MTVLSGQAIAPFSGPEKFDWFDKRNSGESGLLVG